MYWRALKVSVDFLSSEEEDEENNAIQRYQELAIFPKNEFVPEAAIETLWIHTGNLKKRNVDKLLTKLKDRALLRLDGEVPNRLVSLHDLQHDYVMNQMGNLKKVHNQLIQAYKSKCNGYWSTLLDDGYVYKYLPYHLAKAGLNQELSSLLVNFDWLQSKLNVTNVYSLIPDYDYMYDDTDLDIIKNAIRLSAHILYRDKTQLRSQLYGRLMDSKSPIVQHVIRELRELENESCLYPLTTSLTSPNDHLVGVLGSPFCLHCLCYISRWNNCCSGSN